MKKEKKTPYTPDKTEDPAVPNRAHTEMTVGDPKETRKVELPPRNQK